MKLIVGLGNLGKEYEVTRHNAGFIAIDLLLEKYGYLTQKTEFNAQVYFAKINGEKVLFVKPQTYMNNSGTAIRQLQEYYKIAKNDIVIIHDEKDFPIGKNQFRTNGSSAGHNGIKSVIQYLSGQDFKRWRLGIGQPNEGWQIIDWVLSKFSSLELDQLKHAISQGLSFVDDLTKNEDFNKIMSKYN